VHGFGMVGGKRSRGLGACELQELTVSSLELVGNGISPEEGQRRLQNYLISRTFSTEKESGPQFLGRHIKGIFALKG
jgi:hypothetical protein